MCFEIVSKFKSNGNVGALVNYLLPKELTTDEVYVKITDIVKTLEDENGNIIYTPANLVYLKHSCGNKKFIEKRLLDT